MSDKEPTVAILHRPGRERPWFLAWVAPFQQTFCYYDTREEAVSVARKLALGDPDFEGDFCAYAAKSPSSITLPTTVALEAWIEVADVMLADALAKRGVR